MLATIRALWGREIRKFVRDRARVIGALVQPLAFWVLLGLGFYDSFKLPGEGAPAVSYLEYLFPGILALILLFTAIFSTISMVEERHSGFLQAALVAPVSRLTLVLGSLAGGTTLAVGQALLFVALAPVIGVPLTLVGFLWVTVASVLVAVAFTALGIAIAWRMETTRGFHAVMNLLLLPMWLLSGAFFPAEGVPGAVRWVMYLNPAFYGVALLRDGLYWPGVAPGGSVLPLPLALLGAALFAVVAVALAVQSAKRSLY